MNKKSWLLSLLCLFCLMAKAAPTDFRTATTKVSVEFYTPSIVRTTKYLPKGADWYDFWTNKLIKGGKKITFETQFDRVPMFVRAGSILPLGEEMQYVGEKSWSNLELRVYPGADADFTLYEDEGDNYNYEKGIHSTIAFHWNNATRTLTIADREGSFPGMLTSRQFNVVLPDGSSKMVEYSGKKVEVKM